MLKTIHDKRSNNAMLVDTSRNAMVADVEFYSNDTINDVKMYQNSDDFVVIGYDAKMLNNPKFAEKIATMVYEALTRNIDLD